MIKVYRTRTKDVFMSLVDRVSRANKQGVALFVSLHGNGSQYKSAKGYEDFIHTSPLAASRVVQDIFNDELAAVFAKYGSPDRGKKRAAFYVIRYTKMPAILLELGFMTSPDDQALRNNPAFMADMVSAIDRATRKALEYLKGDSVWFDEGHGGHSSGAVSPDGTREADFVLQVSDMLEASLTKVHKAEGFVHTAKAGDTYSKIAQIYGVATEDIMAVNPWPATAIPIGAEIIIPSGDHQLHTIKSGDTYWSLAPQYGVTPEQIEAANPGVDPRSLQIGQEIRIPLAGGAGSKPSKPAPKPSAPVLRVGGKAKIRDGARDLNNGRTFAKLARERANDVKEIVGDRVVLTYQGGIVGAISRKDAIPV